MYTTSRKVYWMYGGRRTGIKAITPFPQKFGCSDDTILFYIRRTLRKTKTAENRQATYPGKLVIPC